MTPPDPQQVAEIAGRLSKAQRDFIISRPTPAEWANWTSWLPATERRQYPGLVRRDGMYSNAFTALGRRVQAHLKGNHHD